MFPIGDDNSARKTFPLVTYALIALNALFFFVELSGGEAFVMQWAFVPRRFMADPFADASTLFSSMFMHAGWLHLGGNMLYLWIFGDNVEDRLGSGPYLIFYLLCGIVAAIGQGLIAPEAMVGASGAIAGVLGAYLVMYPTARVSTLIFLGIFISVVQLPALIVIGFFIVLQVIDALAELRMTDHQAASNIAYVAHIFGFVAGVLLLFLFRQQRDARRFRYD